MFEKRRFNKLLRHVGLGLLALAFAIAILPTATHSYEPAPVASINRSATNLIQQGKAQAAAGRYGQAATLWQQAAANYRQQGDSLREATSLSYLSFAYLQLGQLELATSALQQSKTLLQQVSDRPGTAIILAGTLNAEGSLQLAMGETQAALETWQAAAQTYELAGDEIGKLGATINQAQALQTLGLYRQSRTTLEQVNQQLQSQPDTLMKATGLRSLGVALQVVGDLERSTNALQQSLTISQKLGANSSISATLFSLGNTARANQQLEAAIDYYQQAATIATTPLDRSEALLSQLEVYIEAQRLNPARALLPQLQEAVQNLSPSRMSVYARVNLAESLMKMGLGEVSPIGNARNVAQLLATGVQQAKQLHDSRAESYALGQLGKLYRQTGQLADAKRLTETALAIAEGTSSPEITARWEGQLGGILQQQGDLTGAIAAYDNAVRGFEFLRSDLVAIDSEVQFSFRDSIEPIYRQLVSLLLRDNPSQDDLQQARKVIESLQLAELDNFFRDACLDVQAQQIDRVDPTAAIIYPIILPDRLETILSLPGQPLRHYQTVLPQAEIENILRKSRQSLSLSVSKPERLQLYSTVYDWLIRPVASELTASGVKTLVFVLDGSLRNLPMSALYDGERYLIEDYSIALTPGLQLLEPRPLSAQQIETLIGGLSQSRQGFVALPGVESEVERVAAKVSSQVLLNQKFTNNSLERAISETSSPILHLATHGQFSSNSKETFILTWDDKINVVELGDLLRDQNRTGSSKIELLVLSACQTAKGDNRAVLGLAGLAVRSGARSTMATLWAVRDRSTADLMAEFYKQLASPESTKAEALRQAQLSLLNEPQYEHPFFWAPFVLVGNWL